LSRLCVAVVIAGAAGAVDVQSTNLSLYGRLNLDVEDVRGLLTDGDDGWRTRVGYNSSRLELRGSESIGGGPTALFQIESSVSADAGGGTIAGRDTRLGLRGEWGKARDHFTGRYTEGLNWGAQYAFAERDSSGTFSFGGTWTSGPWQLGWVYQYNNGARIADLDDWGYSIAGAYDFGVFQLAAEGK